MAIATNLNAINDMQHGDQIMVRNETFTLEVSESGGVSLYPSRSEQRLFSIRCNKTKGAIFSRNDLISLLLSGNYFLG